MTDEKKTSFVSDQEKTEFNSPTVLTSATLLYPHPGRPILWTACYSCSFSLLITRERTQPPSQTLENPLTRKDETYSATDSTAEGGQTTKQ